MSPSRTTISVTAITAFLLTPAVIAGEAYVFDDDHTEIRFSWDHLGFSTTSAYFREFSGTLHFDEDDPTASEFDMTIPMEGLDTGRPEFTEELLGADFFDADNHPEANFTTTDIRTAGDDRYTLDGELTLRGTTQEVSLDVTINQIDENPITGARTIGFDAAGEVLRSDFGMDEFVPMVGDEVQIEISAEMMRADDLD